MPSLPLRRTFRKCTPAANGFASSLLPSSQSVIVSLRIHSVLTRRNRPFDVCISMGSSIHHFLLVLSSDTLLCSLSLLSRECGSHDVLYFLRGRRFHSPHESWPQERMSKVILWPLLGLYTVYIHLFLARAYVRGVNKPQSSQ